MRKHFLRTLVVLLMACLGVGVLAACGDGTNPETPPETYTVAFSLGDESHAASGVTAPASQTGKKVGDAITLTALNAAEGYKFDGWYSKSGKVNGTTYTVAAADAVEGTITLTAHWAEDTPAPTAATIENVWTLKGGAIPSYMSGGVPAESFDYEVSVQLAEDGQSGHAVILLECEIEETPITFAFGFAITKSGDNYTATLKFENHDEGSSGGGTGEAVATVSNTLQSIPVTLSVANDKLTIAGFTAQPLVLEKGEGLPANISPSGKLYHKEDPIAYDFTNKKLYYVNEQEDTEDEIEGATFAKVGKYILICYSGETVHDATASHVVYEEDGHYYLFGGEGEAIELVSTKPDYSSGGGDEPVPTPATCTVTFAEGDHGTLGDAQPIPDQKEGDSVSLPAVDADTGYEFEGWYKGGQKVADANANHYTVTADDAQQNSITLTAQYTAIEYTLTFDTAKPAEATDDKNITGDPTTDKKVTLEHPAVSLPDIALEGYLFKGWEMNGSSGTTTSFELTTQLIEGLQGDNTTFSFTAQWEQEQADKVQITFEKGDVGDDAVENMPSNEQVEEGTYNIPDKTPTREGYTFTGWKVTTPSGDNNTYKYGDPTYGSLTVTVGTHVTFTAQWDIKTPQITLDLGGSASSIETPTAVWKEETKTYEITLPTETPVLADHRFDGWTVTGGTLGIEDKANIITVELSDDMNVTITAKWVEVFTVKFFKDEGDYDGDPFKSITVDSGTVITNDDEYSDLGTPDKTNYTFAGWKLKHNGSSLEGATADSSIAEGHVITVYATWTLDKELDLGTITAGTNWAEINYTYPEALKEGDVLTLTGTLALTGAEAVHRWEGVYFNFSKGGDWAHNAAFVYDWRINEISDGTFPYTKEAVEVWTDWIVDTTGERNWSADMDLMATAGYTHFEAKISYLSYNLIEVLYTFKSNFTPLNRDNGEHTLTMRYQIRGELEDIRMSIVGENATLTNAHISRSTLAEIAASIQNTQTSVTEGVKVGKAAEDNYWGTDFYTLDIKAGQTVTLTGEMRSMAGDNFHGVCATIRPYQAFWSDTFNFRFDNFVTAGVDVGGIWKNTYERYNFSIDKAFKRTYTGYGTDGTAYGNAEDETANGVEYWTAFKTAMTDCDLTVTVDWSENADKIVVKYAFTSKTTSGYSSEQTYTITPLKAGTHLAPVYTYTLRPDHSWVENPTVNVTYTNLNAD